jgi:hypothetical protein
MVFDRSRTSLAVTNHGRSVTEPAYCDRVWLPDDRIPKDPKVDGFTQMQTNPSGDPLINKETS